VPHAVRALTRKRTLRGAGRTGKPLVEHGEALMRQSMALFVVGRVFNPTRVGLKSDLQRPQRHREDKSCIESDKYLLLFAAPLRRCESHSSYFLHWPDR
jgi:hypothetical protein